MERLSTGETIGGGGGGGCLMPLAVAVLLLLGALAMMGGDDTTNGNTALSGNEVFSRNQVNLLSDVYNTFYDCYGAYSCVTTTSTTSTTTTSTTTSDPSTTSTSTTDPGTSSTTSPGSSSDSGNGQPPPPPTMPAGCNVCDCCDPWPISWAAVPEATHYVVRWKCSINPEQVHDVGDKTAIADVCNDIDMCNGMCAFTVGYIKVQACNDDGCSALVDIPAAPITCGGGCCC